jgi:hypothetical protein
MRSVVKHSYVKGMQKAAKAKAHVNYIQYRNGEDRGKEPRSFFDDKREGKQGREVKQEIDKVGGKFVHKLILSPGVPGVDVQAYTRQVMHDVGRSKGLDLNWSAVVHTNTDNAHAHVVVLGKDKQGREVQLGRDDYITARQAGDRYLERHHELERFLVRDVDLSKKPDYRPQGDRVYQELVKELTAPSPDQAKEKEKAEPYNVREWDRDQALKALSSEQRIQYDGREYTKFSNLDELKQLGEWIKQPDVQRLDGEDYKRLRSWIGTKERGGDDYYERLAKNKWDKREKKREKKQERLPGEDEREFKKLDHDLKKMFKDLDREGSGDTLGKGYRERQREQQGRLGAEHGHSSANQEIERLKREAESEPARQQEIEKQIEEVKRWDQEQRQADSRWGDLDAMLGERYGREQRELAELLRPYEQKQEPNLDEKEREKEPERQTESSIEEREPEKDQGKDLENQPEPGREVSQDKPKEQDAEPERAVEPSPDGALDKPLEQSADDRSELLQDGQELKDQEPELEPTVTESKWQDLDAMLGDRFGRDEYDERQIGKELEIAQSQQEMRQFQDLHNMQEQTPQLEEQELDRDSGEDYFARGEY